MKIAVIGVGTAGIVSLCYSLSWLCPKGSTVTSIYDPKVKILSVGESMDPNFTDALFNGTGFNVYTDGPEIDATLKIGGHWINWRNPDFIMATPSYNYALHFNNGKLKEFCFNRFPKVWGDKFQIIEGTVTDLVNAGDQAHVTVDGKLYDFDYVFDCRGWPDNWEDYNIIDLPVNHVLINVTDEVSPDRSVTATVHQAHANGWMFGVPLTTRKAWGYLYNDTITTREEAVADIERIFNKKDIKLNEFTFKSYYARQFFDGRIMKNGNRAMFFEPMASLAGFFYDTICRALDDYDKGVYSVDEVNQILTNLAQNQAMFINYVYHGGSTFESEFWDITKKKCTEQLLKNSKWIDTVIEVNQNIKDQHTVDKLKIVKRWTVGMWLKWEKNFQYNYFKKAIGFYSE